MIEDLYQSATSKAKALSEAITAQGEGFGHLTPEKLLELSRMADQVETAYWMLARVLESRAGRVLVEEPHTHSIELKK